MMGVCSWILRFIQARVAVLVCVRCGVIRLFREASLCSLTTGVHAQKLRGREYRVCHRYGLSKKALLSMGLPVCLVVSSRQRFANTLRKTLWCVNRQLEPVYLISKTLQFTAYTCHSGAGRSQTTHQQ